MSSLVVYEFISDEQLSSLVVYEVAALGVYEFMSYSYFMSL
jgi:hypothetical protein